MQLSLNSLYNFFGSKATGKRLGRGIGSGKGKTSGRGVKGQKARSGVSIRWFEGGQTSIVKRLFKRGFCNKNKTTFNVVNIASLNELIQSGVISAGSSVNSQTLFNFGMIKKQSNPIKLLGKEILKVNLVFDLYVHYCS